MDNARKKAVIAAYKERKVPAGIYAVHCGGQVWVGQSPNLTSVENRLRFTLDHGSHPNAALQRAWNALAEKVLRVEVVETLAEETDPYLRGKALSERLDHWKAVLGARRI
ncbi:hypothetical protein GCM10007301_00390 [Azorhizobium oxalatiphilum]|uniref:GIY-YIG nuclease family protein n=1 Tax=Azorhizobium oxalatiphilum TaxID=980631 RepID=A0A917BI14_9HYPH|nr:GIY-YIG nuclease family protein [Azorhizobium oxalatiphilum]GGF44786.1 hypothetical protein GCM10007301_00390 [Azorhizobium oxalatiphilum]